MIKQKIIFIICGLLILSSLVVPAGAVSTPDDDIPTNIAEYNATNPGFMPCKGDARVLVFNVSFVDTDMSKAKTNADLQKIFFDDTLKYGAEYSQVFSPDDSLSAYFYRESNGELNITGDVFDYTCIGTASDYNVFSIASVNIAYNTLFNELTDYFKTAINYGNYDANSDGYIDGVYLYFNTNDNFTANTNSYCYSFTPEIKTGHVTVCINTSLSTICHETIHQLGPMDIYNGTGVNSSGSIGQSIMEGDGIAIPAPIKLLFGWCKCIDYIREEGLYNLQLGKYSDESNIAILYPANETDFKSLFFLEYLDGQNDLNGIRLWKVLYNLDDGNNIQLYPESTIAKSPFVFIEALTDYSGKEYLLKTGDEITPYTAVNTSYVKNAGKAYYFDEFYYDNNFSGISIKVNSLSDTANITVIKDNSPSVISVSANVQVVNPEAVSFAGSDSNICFAQITSAVPFNDCSSLTFVCEDEEYTASLTMSVDHKTVYLYAAADILSAIGGKSITIDLSSMNTYYGAEIIVNNTVFVLPEYPIILLQQTKSVFQQDDALYVYSNAGKISFLALQSDIFGIKTILDANTTEKRDLFCLPDDVSNISGCYPFGDYCIIEASNGPRNKTYFWLINTADKTLVDTYVYSGNILSVFVDGDSLFALAANKSIYTMTVDNTGLNVVQNESAFCPSNAIISGIEKFVIVNGYVYALKRQNGQLYLMQYTSAESIIIKEFSADECPSLSRVDNFEYNNGVISFYITNNNLTYYEYKVASGNMSSKIVLTELLEYNNSSVPQIQILKTKCGKLLLTNLIFPGDTLFGSDVCFECDANHYIIGCLRTAGVASRSYIGCMYNGKCQTLADTKLVEIDPITDNFRLSDEVEGDCSNKGKLVYTNTYGKSYEEETEYGDHIIITDEAVTPTCEQIGLTEGSHCSVCNTVFTTQEIISATGHKEITVDEVPSTCIETGHSSYTVCEYCGQHFTEPSKFPLAVHQGGIPTCTQKAVCDVCKQEYGDFGSHSYGSWVDEIPATCISGGVKGHYKCSACGKVFYSSFNEITSLTLAVDPNNHTGATEFKNTSNPSCEIDGYTGDIYCSDCNKILKKGEDIEAIGHKMGEWIIIKNPSCISNGSKVRYCSNNGCEYSETEFLEPGDHSYIEHPATAASCVEAGNELYYTCETCSSIFNSEKVVIVDVPVIPSTGHSYTAIVTPPTCTEKGYTLHICSCGDQYEDTYVKAKGHIDDGSGYCAECGEKLGNDDTPSNGSSIWDLILAFFRKIIEFFKKIF